MRLSRHTDHTRTIRAFPAALVLALVAALCAAFAPTAAYADEAPSLSDGGYLVSDGDFFDGRSMSADDIQWFLESKVSSCRASSGPDCLKNFRTSMPSIGADRYCGAIEGGANLRASDVIARVGAACGVSPKVILVMLQKEQGLVTSTAPSNWSYRAAMGMSCPDTAPCDAAAAGFVNQVHLGARQQQVYAQNPQWFRYKAGQVNTIQWHPNTSCGTSQVYIRNQATANLYNYTPYRPNAASIAAGTGTGNGCSSYGNRNFFTYFASWFGHSGGSSGGVPAANPCSVPADVQAASGTVTVTTDILNARQAPSTSCGTGLVQFREGKTGVRTGAHGQWWRVEVDGKSYWMHSDYLSVAEAPTPAPTPAPAEPTPAVTTDALNLRSGPSLTASIITVLPRGASVAVTEQNDVWRKVTVDGRTGWVHSDFLTAPGAAPTTAFTTDALNLRTDASMSAAVQTVLGRGTTVTVTGSSGPWRAVTVGGRSGWVHGDFLSTDAPASVTKQTTDAVNLRSGASMSAGVQTVIPRGVTVTITGADGVWQQVQVGGRTGWMHGDWLR